MRFAMVGCGYVADFYIATLPNHPELELAGVLDRDTERARHFAEFHGVKRYDSLEELLGDTSVDLVANLTNPRGRFAISKAALDAGKHVYSEKPLALDLDEATQLVELAEKLELVIASAPCNLLGETAQTIWKALRERRIGVPRLIYAEIDDGAKPLQNRTKWLSDSGIPWPAKDEFEMGCIIEHAGYYLCWLTAFFGPVTHMTTSAHVLMPEKGIQLDRRANDFSVGCFEFASGPTARLTCSIYAPDDRRLRIYGDGGILSTEDCWDFGAPVHLSRRTPLRLRGEAHPRIARAIGLGPTKVAPVRKSTFRFARRGSNPMDFCRGIGEVADALAERRPPRLTARWSLHVTELVLAMQMPETYGTQRTVSSSFEPLEPMPWAR